MKRILLMVFRNLFRIPYRWCKLCYMASHVDRYTEEERFQFLKEIVQIANRGGNVTIEAHGLENIPEQNGYLIYPNHQGLYDALALIHVCPRPISAVIKKEATTIPFIKQCVACLNAFGMDREDLRQSMEVILKVIKEVKKGRNYVIFAEGTRSRRGNELLEFKAGSFKPAVKTKCPILPVALIDSFKPFDTNSIAPVTVQLHFLPPMEYEEYKDMNTVEIAQEVKGRIEEKIALELQK